MPRSIAGVTAAPDPSNAPGARAFRHNKRPMSAVGIIFVGKSDAPRLHRIQGHCYGDVDARTIQDARERLMRSAALRFGVPAADVEVHDVMVLDGHTDELTPARQRVAA